MATVAASNMNDDQGNNNHYYFDGNASEMNNDNEDDTATDYLVFLCCGVLAALWCSFTAVVVGIYAWWEDCLLRQEYLHHGLSTSATIVACSVARSLSDQPEYAVRLVYCYPGTISTTTHKSQYCRSIIYKDVKLLAPDLVSSNVSAYDGDSQNSSNRSIAISWNSSLHIPHEVVTAARHGQSDSTTAGNSSKQPHPHNHSHLHNKYVGQHIDLLVLPDHPRSGLPLAFVERLCSWGYRLPTVALVLTAISLAIVCVTIVTGHLGIAVAIVLLLIMLEAIIVVGYGGPALQQSLHDMYHDTDAAASVATAFTEDTLSSGDDSYLRIA
jgi:hypothetical protein